MCGACAQPQCKPAAAITVLVLHNGGFYENICFALPCVCECMFGSGEQDALEE